MDTTTALIKRLRGLGLSQTEISRRTGIPQPRLSRWESGLSPTVADDALKLAALDASLTKRNRRKTDKSAVISADSAAQPPAVPSPAALVPALP